MTFVAATIAFDSNKKPPCPKPGQARRLRENGVVLCIRVNQCPVWRSLFTFTLFHVRKVHENLIGAQPAHWRIARFFSAYARQFTYAPRRAVIHRRRRTSLCALDRVGKCDCRAARKNHRIKASQLPPGCLRSSPDRRALRAIRFRIRERLRLACAPSPHTVFKFVAIMRQSPTNGKHNAAVHRMHTAFDDRMTRDLRTVNWRPADRKTARNPCRHWCALSAARSSRAAGDYALTLLMRTECIALNYRGQHTGEKKPGAWRRVFGGVSRTG